MEGNDNEQGLPADGEDGQTSPDEPIHEATSPPGSGPLDDEAVREAEDKLGQAGAGH